MPGAFGGFRREYTGSTTADDLRFNTNFTPTMLLDAATKEYVDDEAAAATATPGGVDTSVQYNDSGSFGGDAAFTFNSGTGTMTSTTVTGTATVTATDISATDTASGNNVSITNLVTAPTITASGNVTGNNVTATNAVSGTTVTATTTASAPAVIATDTMTGANVDATTSLRVGSGAVDASAVVTANSTTQGLLPPRMTTAQRTGIASPAEGLIVMDTDDDSLYVYQDSAWTQLAVVPTRSYSLVTFQSTTQTGVTAGTVINFPNNILVNGTNISYGGAGIFTVLTDGTQTQGYLFTAHIHTNGASVVPEFAWVLNGGTRISGAQTFVTAVDAATDNSSSSCCQVLYIPPAVIPDAYFVVLQCIATSSAVTVQTSTHATVIEIM